MQRLVLLAIFAVMTVAYVAITFRLPGVVKLVPELLSALMIPFIIVAGSRQRFEFFAAKYWLLCGTLLFCMICGLLINDVDSGPTIAGLRNYLRIAPFFLLPATFEFKEGQLKQQLRLLLVLALTQVPFASFQRWQLWRQGRFTGDLVVGTLNDSGILSIFLIGAVLVLTGLVLRDRISKPRFTILFFLLLLPTTINETKATVILLPLGLLTALVVGSVPGRRLRIVGAAAALLVCFGAIFVPVYDLMQTNNPYKKDITTFFTDKEQLGKYMEAKRAGVGSVTQVGRGDALRIPIQYLARDPVQFMFGLGIGNASESSLGKAFTGKYAAIFSRITITAFSTFFLELGLLGTGLLFLLYWLIFRDTLFVARHDRGLFGALAVGWAGVTALIVVSTVYTNIQIFESLSFLFWFLSGLMTARRVHLSRKSFQPIHAADSAAPAPSSEPDAAVARART